MTSQEIATQKLMVWLQTYHPDFFATLPRATIVESGLGDWTSIISTITNAALQYDANRIARKQIELNIARAQVGQDPVTFDANGNPKLPSSVSLSASGSANSNLLILGTAGVIIAFLLLRGKK